MKDLTKRQAVMKLRKMNNNRYCSAKDDLTVYENGTEYIECTLYCDSKSFTTPTFREGLVVWKEYLNEK